MLNKEENLQSTVQGTDEARHTHETGYQVIDGVAITPELLERAQILQTDCNEGITSLSAVTGIPATGLVVINQGGVAIFLFTFLVHIKNDLYVCCA